MTVKCVESMVLPGETTPKNITIYEDNSVLLSLEAGFSGIPDYEVAKENGWQIVDKDSNPFNFFTCAVERRIPVTTIMQMDFEQVLNDFVEEVSRKMPQGRTHSAAKSLSAAWCAGYTEKI